MAPVPPGYANDINLYSWCCLFDSLLKLMLRCRRQVAASDPSHTRWRHWRVRLDQRVQPWRDGRNLDKTQLGRRYRFRQQGFNTRVHMCHRLNGWQERLFAWRLEKRAGDPVKNGLRYKFVLWNVPRCLFHVVTNPLLCVRNSTNEWHELCTSLVKVTVCIWNFISDVTNRMSLTYEWYENCMCQ